MSNEMFLIIQQMKSNIEKYGNIKEKVFDINCMQKFIDKHRNNLKVINCKLAWS